MPKLLRFFPTKIQTLLLVTGLTLLTALPRLTALNQYLIVDEADRWRWVKNFVNALSRGDLAATVGEVGYPGLVPIWAGSLWVWLEAGRRSLLEGRWIGEPGLYLIMHEWDRAVNLIQQRLPVVLLNTALTLLIIWFVWRRFGRWLALLSGVLIALDPFYLTDSRVNRADALITSLMTLSILALTFYDQHQRRSWLLLSGVFGGLAFVTKIQALAMLPAVALILLFIVYRRFNSLAKDSLLSKLYPLGSVFGAGLLWAVAAAFAWYLLWPVMWVQPAAALASVYDLATLKVGAEGADMFFFGQTHTDPGPWFYPFVFLMRLTPLALLGFIYHLARIILYLFRPAASSSWSSLHLRSSVILLIYLVLYLLAMVPSTHKQDRYLLPVFLGVDILAAIGWYHAWLWLKSKISDGHQKVAASPLLPALLLAGFTLVQIVAVVPHHPYYYSFFNPLFGGGQTAARTLRIGWGEGMDQVGAYLAAKPNSRELVVASRFTHNMLGFKGPQISLLPNGRWTQADYVVMYIQQVQRQEPSPGFINFFQRRTPEKVITIAGIDYAWIYPMPFSQPANPQLNFIADQAALLGYHWEERGQLRLFWENRSANSPRLVTRLRGKTAHTNWSACLPDRPFSSQPPGLGDYVESLCAPALTGLPAGTYHVEFGLEQGDQPAAEPELFFFPQGWHAATLTPGGEMIATPEVVRLEAAANDLVPREAPRLERIYDDRIRLLAYQLEPVMPQPGQTITLKLYWQRLTEAAEPVQVTAQLADSRSLNLGRVVVDLPADTPYAGQVVATEHKFALAAELERPLAGQIEVSLHSDSEIPLPSTNSAGQEMGPIIARFTILAARPPSLAGVTQVNQSWQNGLALQGYTLSARSLPSGETFTITFFWQTSQAVAENYRVFVHLLTESGQILAQSDALPRAGAYPTPWWQPGVVVEDSHTLTIPTTAPEGLYQLAVGLYLPETGERLRLTGGADHVVVGQLEIQ